MFQTSLQKCLEDAQQCQRAADFEAAYDTFERTVLTPWQSTRREQSKKDQGVFGRHFTCHDEAEKTVVPTGTGSEDMEAHHKHMDLEKNVKRLVNRKNRPITETPIEQTSPRPENSGLEAHYMPAPDRERQEYTEHQSALPCFVYIPYGDDNNKSLDTRAAGFHDGRRMYTDGKKSH